MTENSDLRNKVQACLDKIRPALQGDGGDCELVDVSPEGVVTLHLVGSCSGCPSSTMTLRMGIEQALKEEIPEVKELVTV
ncbi:MAG: NifU family protein [Candidatus Omnitrophica bacterium]|nr:NifU family protein [Candidatus Omnitrophota bacterium]